MTVEKSVYILCILWVTLNNKRSHSIHILWMKQRSGMVLLKRCISASREFANILYPSSNEVIALNALGNGLIIKTIFLDGVLINEIIHDLTKRIFWINRIGKVEVATIMTKANIASIGDVLPCPILCSHLTVHWVFLGNAIALIVMEHIRKAITLLTWSHLNRLKVVACGNINIFMRSDKNANRLLLKHLYHVLSF